MADTMLRCGTDALIVERSFALDSHLNLLNPRTGADSHHGVNESLLSTGGVSKWRRDIGCSEAGRQAASKRGPDASGVGLTMPASSGQESCAVSAPSFRSPFGEEASRTSLADAAARVGPATTHDGMIRSAASDHACSGHTLTTNNNNNTFTSFHQHRDSTSTSASESTDSSPTTTISTIDSASMTDPSPGASPESPVSNMSGFGDTLRQRPGDQGRMESMQAHFVHMKQPVTPAKKPRNLKGLAVNTSTASANLGRAISTAQPTFGSSTTDKTTSAPASPSFVKPLTPPKKKQPCLNLTIQTPGHSNLPMRLAIPPTPSLKRPNMLRHFQSSPALPQVSPLISPESLQARPSLHFQRQNSQPLVALADIPMEEEEEDQEPNFDVPQSREEKPAAYPNGPICIYETGVFLYFEPSAEQASQYDVIMNVASEVKNPFAISGNTAPSPDPLKNPSTAGIDFALAQRDIAALAPKSDAPQMPGSFAEDSPMRDSSPTTPKATPLPESVLLEASKAKSEPEYIHIPWEHNTDIVPDLYNLVKTIEERVQKGKRVLVHCQCGVSRSASLIVAYGLYKNPGISVQEAYDAVKKRSKWIGPNMNLIMQLQEFRSALLRQRGESAFRTPGYVSRRLSPHIATATSDPRSSTFAPELLSSSLTPRTAPLPPELNGLNAHRASTGNILPATPGPLSAPLPGSPKHRSSWDVGQKAPSGLAAPPMAVTTDSPHTSTTRPELPEPKNRDRQSTISSESSEAPTVRSVRDSVPNFSRQLPLRQEHGNEQEMTETDYPELKSPVRTEFTLPLQPLRDDAMNELMSPQRAEFGPSLFKREPENGFDLASPTTSSFPADIMNVNGASTAVTNASKIFNRPLPLRDAPATHSQPQPQSLGDVLNAPVQAPEPPPPQESTTPTSIQEPATQHSPPSVVGSPPRRKLRTKYSMPDLKTQRRLQRMQADLEAHLPNRSPNLVADRAADDIDALMSPRATEFTRNPFHELMSQPAVSDPAATTAATDARTGGDDEPALGFDFEFPRGPGQDGQTTPTAADPRSPAVTGGNPITRSIFDVL